MPDDFTTHATNFSGALQTGVDPRTCQFFLSFPLPEVLSHRLLGPRVSLSLNYSALSAANTFGLGKGVSLGGISAYDQKSRRILLSNGESWFVDGGGAILNRKLKDCTFEYLAHETEGEYVLRWKNGTKEILTEIGSQRYLTTKVVAPTGRAVIFKWNGNGSLQSVKEQAGNTVGQTILLFGYDAAHDAQGPNPDVTITLWPGKAESCQTGLFLQGSYLTRLSFLDYPEKKTVMQWAMVYKSGGLLGQITHPTGLEEEILYHEGNDGSGVLKFPSQSKLPALPAVDRHVRRYGRGQPDYTATYTHTERNFLGCGASSQFGTWSKGGDYLYRMLTDEYTYGSTETWHSPDGKEIREIVREYDNYHRLISETSTQGNCSSKKKIVYHGEYNTDIKSQPCTYHFPHLQTITWSDQRPETTETTFDDYGNPVQVIHPDGTTETYSWYPAEGVTGLCPAEPNKFVRFLHQKTVKPPVSHYPTPSHTVEYTYEKLGGTECVVQVTETDYSDAGGNRTCLSRRETRYASDITDPEFGRITSIDTKYAGSGGQDAAYTLSQHVETHVDRLGHMTQKITDQAHDGLTITCARTLSVLTGRTLEDTDIHGIVTKYTYDALGRILSGVHAVGTKYSTMTQWSYSIEKKWQRDCRSGNDQGGRTGTQGTHPV
ncbi:YD repeat protein [Burkholderia ambifaria MEX-5]|uniref:YD repeat protein n=2 Tax=Burkholderia ambifaria TaxID=152480 RepID=B1TFR4_9BURK|nr:YD repeat protein [Burkholderia ambifaria MEX-5]